MRKQLNLKNYITESACTFNCPFFLWGETMLFEEEENEDENEDNEDTEDED